MKLGQLIKHNARNIILQKIKQKKEAGRLVSDLFLLFKKALYKVKASGKHLKFNIIW